MDNFTKAVIAGAFIMGMGTGVWFNSEATFYPSNVASTEVIDRHTPNSEVCMANGYSSMVFDERVFVSFNPCAPLACACLCAQASCKRERVPSPPAGMHAVNAGLAPSCVMRHGCHASAGVPMTCIVQWVAVARSRAPMGAASMQEHVIHAGVEVPGGSK